MKSSPQADHYWKVLLAAHPRRSRFRLNDLLEAFHDAFPHHEGDLNARQRLAGLLGQLAEEGFLRLPKIANRRAYDHGERTLLPRYVNRIDLPQPPPKETHLWRPELAFARGVSANWHDTLAAIQEWLRGGGTETPFVALRERSVEIFGDEKYLDGLVGTQLFSPGRLSLDLLRCYLPSVPICVEAISVDGHKRPLLVLENQTTFDTLRRWNHQHRHYSAVAFGGGTAFVSSCRTLGSYLTLHGCTGTLLYFGDMDPKGLWIPVRAARESGIPVHPDEDLYELLFQSAQHKFVVQGEAIVCDPSLLDWLPEHLRRIAAQHLENGRRLPQELISINDLEKLPHS